MLGLLNQHISSSWLDFMQLPSKYNEKSTHLQVEGFCIPCSMARDGPNFQKPSQEVFPTWGKITTQIAKDTEIVNGISTEDNLMGQEAQEKEKVLALSEVEIKAQRQNRAKWR